MSDLNLSLPRESNHLHLPSDHKMTSNPKDRRVKLRHKVRSLLMSIDSNLNLSEYHLHHKQ